MVEETPILEPGAKSSLDAPLPSDEKAAQDAAKETEEGEGTGIKSEPTGFDSDGRPTGVKKVD